MLVQRCIFELLSFHNLMSHGQESFSIWRFFPALTSDEVATKNEPGSVPKQEAKGMSIDALVARTRELEDESDKAIYDQPQQFQYEIETRRMNWPEC